MATRRAILQTGGAAVLIVGAGAWALTRAPEKARAPWSAAGGSFGDARLDCLAFAILAPNPHNMQPWRITLAGEDEIVLHCDLARRLPETDPPSRQITIGFGAFIELLRQAAAERGLAAIVTPFPEGEPQPNLDERPIARIRLAPDAAAARDPLFAATLSRRTNRAPFEGRAVEPEALSRIAAVTLPGVVVRATIEASEIADLKRLAKDAWAIEWGLDRTRRESIAVTRVGKAAIEAEPWGLSLAGPMLEALKIAGFLTPEKMDGPGNPAYDQALSGYAAAIDATPAFLSAATATNTRADQLATGAAWVRMQQAATLAGVAFQPLSQALQEFPEMAPAYDRAHEMLAHQQGATVQMLTRLGYAKAPPPAPREALEAKLVKA